MDKCELCLHKNVCQFKDKLKELNDQLSQLQEPFELNINCKEFDNMLKRIDLPVFPIYPSVPEPIYPNYPVWYGDDSTSKPSNNDYYVYL